MKSYTPLGLWLIVLFLAPIASAQPQIVCSGQAAGGYAAFPDICRLPDGELFCVFYSGYTHISRPNAQWPRGGRIMAVRSSDLGRSWSKLTVIIDTPYDDRDPSVACLKNSTMILDWFTPRPDLHGKDRMAVMLARSTDRGKTWSEAVELKLDSPLPFACSSPVRELSDGSLILGLYHEDSQKNLAFGATVKSYDGGKTWKDLALIGQNSGVYLDAETDVVQLSNGHLLAALRSSRTNMHYAESLDAGNTWGTVKSFGFKGHSPYFLRHSSGTLLLAHRLPATALHWRPAGSDTWRGPLQIDSVIGAYPSMAELPDRDVFCVYYEEGKGSGIRGVRLRVEKGTIQLDATPEPGSPEGQRR
jgi:hypothetical protein